MHVVVASPVPANGWPATVETWLVAWLVALWTSTLMNCGVWQPAIWQLFVGPPALWHAEQSEAVALCSVRTSPTEWHSVAFGLPWQLTAAVELAGSGADRNSADSDHGNVVERTVLRRGVVGAAEPERDVPPAGMSIVRVWAAEAAVVRGTGVQFVPPLVEYSTRV